MSAGRRVAAIAVGCLVLLVVTSASASAIRIPRAPKMRTDGTLTVGGQERLVVRNVSPGLNLKAAVISEDVPRACFDFFNVECTAQPLFRLPGTPRFRGSRKGRAAISFVMPPAWEFIDDRNPIASHAVPFANGEQVLVELSGIVRKPHSLTEFGFGGTRAVVEVTTAPPG